MLLCLPTITDCLILCTLPLRGESCPSVAKVQKGSNWEGCMCIAKHGWHSITDTERLELYMRTCFPNAEFSTTSTRFAEVFLTNNIPAAIILFDRHDQWGSPVYPVIHMDTSLIIITHSANEMRETLRQRFPRIKLVGAKWKAFREIPPISFKNSK